MAASMDKLEKNLDRLERFFSKRRKVSIVRDSLSLFNMSKPPHDLASPNLHPDLTEQTFPCPSFIRPITTRMLARDEVNVTARSTRRAHSLPETPNSHDRMPSIDESSSLSSLPIVTFQPKVPKRSSSLFQRRRDPSIAGLLHFSFSEKPGWAANTSTRCSSAEPASPFEGTRHSQPQVFGQLKEPLPIFTTRRPDTPPHSDGEDRISPLKSHFDKPLPAYPTGANLTPEASPRLHPVITETPIRRTSGSRMTSEMKSEKHRSLESPEIPGTRVALLRKTVSDTTLCKAVPASKDNAELQEPTVKDFMKLSDDDIADGHPTTPSPSKPPTFGLPPDPPVSRMPSPRSKGDQLLVLSSPLTSRPATAAAFVAARIAQRFNFTLVYVVNLWPVDLGCSSPTPTYSNSLATPHTSTPSSPLGSRPRVTGRLLAAYGLAAVETPFRISAAAHQKILRSDGWVEWRAERIRPGELARGYGCAFYAGGSSDGKRPETAAVEGGSSNTNTGRAPLNDNNRGIVFAAYRMPRRDGTTPRSDRAELTAIYTEAETLVEMLLDIHKTHRARQQVGGIGRSATAYVAEETGPLPLRPQFSPSGY